MSATCGWQLEDVCVPIKVDVHQTTFSADGGWVAGAFILGLLLGAILAALLVRPCLREWQKKKRQDEEAIAPSVVPAIIAEPVEKKAPKKKKGSLFRRKKKKGEDDVEEELTEPGKYRGMVDVMVQTTSVGADQELARQDLDSVTAMGDDQNEERDMLFLRCLESLVKKLVVKNKISEGFCRTFLKKSREDTAHIRKFTDTEVQGAEEEARNDPKLSKDKQALDNHLVNIHRQADIRMSQRQREHREQMRQHLIRSSGLSEAEIESLLEKLLEQMAAAEARLGQEHARQRRLLEERLAKRRQVLEYNNLQAANQNEDVEGNIEVFDGLLAGLVTAGKLDNKQREAILQQYAVEVEELRKHQQTEALRQRQSLVEKLQRRRERKLQKLADKHGQERQDFLKTSDKQTATTQLIEGYHDLIVKQHREAEETNTDLDQEDIQEMDKLVKEHHNQELSALGERLGMHMAEVGREANMDSGNVNQLLHQHQNQMARYHSSKQRERQAMLARLQERLANRLQNIEQREQEEEVQMGALVEQQTNTLKKVLGTNIELNTEAQERILREHEQNMHHLTNQLQASRLRQQKTLEVKLSGRKARLEELQMKQEQLRQSRRTEKVKDREKMENNLAQEIAAEEERVDKMRAEALAQLRHQLAQETEEVLRQHDQEMGLLIGRLQVGQARRAAILRKQDKTLKELQDQLEDRLTDGELPRSYTDQLLQQHHNHMAHLNDHIQRSRQKQERLIVEKLQTKKHMKENQLESQMEEEAQVEYYQQQQRGAGLASNVLLQILLDQRHEKAMAELESEMKTELEKSKEELNTTLELELQQELDSQKQQFLTQLAAVSDISHDDLHQAVDAAATETGIDERTAKKLAKDLRVGIKRAKTNMSETYGDDDDDDYGSLPRGVEGLGYADDLAPAPAPATGGIKGGKKKKRILRKQQQQSQPRQPTYNDSYGRDDYDDDDDF